MRRSRRKDIKVANERATEAVKAHKLLAGIDDTNFVSERERIGCNRLRSSMFALAMRELNANRKRS